MKKYIIGIGTGRCGTVSCAKLLSGCKNVNVSHEFRERGDNKYRLSWEFKEDEAIRRVNRIKNLNGYLVGDVAHYYLNYVGYFVTCFEKVKFIYLARDMQETVESFMKKSGNFCHWLSPHTQIFKENNYKHIDWDRTFPKYNECKSKKEAIWKYVYDYNLVGDKLVREYPYRFFKINVNHLNIRQKELFDFLEIPEKDGVYQDIWENKSK